MRCFIPGCCTGIDDAAIFWARIEEVGRKAGGFVLRDEEALGEGGEGREVGGAGEGEERGDVLVDMEDLG